MSLTLIAPPLARPRSVDWTLTVGLVLAGTIAWVAPFDRAFNVLTLGSAPLRALAIVLAALVGVTVGRRIGLSLHPVGLNRPILFPLALSAGVAILCAAADWTLQPEPHGAYAEFMRTAPLGLRLSYFILRAFNENVLYRLFLGSVLAWLIGLGWKGPGGRPAEGAFALAFVVSQLLNIGINVASQAPITPAALIYDGVRYVAPGLIWSWLYRRHGFCSNEIACAGAHLFFQPLVTLGLR